ncbi:hypothetical protein ILFOPFJJ_05767 [Ensifer psoraleae]|nr:hypothetical protein [Sinorhizobium psoraleae]
MTGGRRIIARKPLATRSRCMVTLIASKSVPSIMAPQRYRATLKTEGKSTGDQRPLSDANSQPTSSITRKLDTIAKRFILSPRLR